MSKAMKYLKDLEAAGFQRHQAEAQVQMVLDAIEGELVTKSDFALFKEHIDGRFASVDYRFAELEHRFSELELRLITKLGLIIISSTTIAIAVLTWLIKLQ